LSSFIQAVLRVHREWSSSQTAGSGKYCPSKTDGTIATYREAFFGRNRNTHFWYRKIIFLPFSAVVVLNISSSLLLLYFSWKNATKLACYLE